MRFISVLAAALIALPTLAGAASDTAQENNAKPPRGPYQSLTTPAPTPFEAPDGEALRKMMKERSELMRSQSEERREEMRKAMEQRREQFEKQREDFREQMKQRREQAEKQRQEFRQQMEKRRAEMESRFEESRKAAKERFKAIDKTMRDMKKKMLAEEKDAGKRKELDETFNAVRDMMERRRAQVEMRNEQTRAWFDRQRPMPDSPMMQGMGGPQGFANRPQSRVPYGMMPAAPYMSPYAMAPYAPRFGPFAAPRGNAPGNAPKPSGRR